MNHRKMNIMAHDAIFSVISKEILVPIPEESTADETNDETVSLGTSSNASVVSALSWPEYALDDVNFFLICCAGAVWFASYFISVAKIFLGISIFGKFHALSFPHARKKSDLLFII
jgi:hypothetical protein